MKKLSDSWIKFERGTKEICTVRDMETDCGKRCAYGQFLRFVSRGGRVPIWRLQNADEANACGSAYASGRKKGSKTDEKKKMEIEGKASRMSCRLCAVSFARIVPSITETFKASLSNIVFAVQDGMPPFRFLPSSQPRHFGFSSSHGAASLPVRSSLRHPLDKWMRSFQSSDFNSIARGDFLDRLETL